MNKKYKKRGFVYNLMDFYSAVSKNSALSYPSVFIVNVIFTFEITIYALNAFGEVNKDASPSFAYLINLVQFVQLKSLKNISANFYIALQCLVSLVTIINAVAFLLMVHFGSDSALIIRIRRIYCMGNIIVWQILLLPFMELMLCEMFTVGHFSSGFGLADVLNGIASIFLLAYFCQFAYFFHLESFTRDRSFAMASSIGYFDRHLWTVFFGLVVFVDYSSLSTGFSIAFVVLALLHALIRAIILFQYPVYESRRVQLLVLHLHNFYATAIVTAASVWMAPEANFFALFIPIFALATTLAVFYEQADQLSRIHFNSRSAGHMVAWISQLTSLARQKSDQFRKTIVFQGKLASHSRVCQTPSCFCRQNTFYQETKNEFIQTDQKDNPKLFIQKLIVFNLEAAVKSNPQNFAYRYLLALFYLRQVKNRAIASFHINALAALPLRFVDRLKIHAVRRSLQEEQEAANNSAFNGRRIEDLLNLEKAYKQSLELISSIFEKRNEFWAIIGRDAEISSSLIRSKALGILALTKQLKMEIKPIALLENHSNFLMILLEFVRKEIFNKRVMVNLDVDIIKERWAEALRFQGTPELLSDLFKVQFLFKKSCVCVVSFCEREGSMGTVLRISDGITNLFGYEKEEIIGQNISLLMPPPINQLHSRILAQVAETGVFHRKQNGLMTFGMTKNRSPISIRVTYKLNFMANSESELFGLLTPQIMQGDSDRYLLVDSLGFITSASKSLVALLGLNEEKLSRGILNVGALDLCLLEFLPIGPLIDCRDNIQSLPSNSERQEQSGTKKRIKFCELVVAKNSNNSIELESLLLMLKALEVVNLKQLDKVRLKATAEGPAGSFTVVASPIKAELTETRQTYSNTHFGTTQSIEKNSDVLNAFGEQLRFHITERNKGLVKRIACEIEYSEIMVAGETILYVLDFTKVTEDSFEWKNDSPIQKPIDPIDAPRLIDNNLIASGELQDPKLLDLQRQRTNNWSRAETQKNGLIKGHFNAFYKLPIYKPKRRYGRIRFIQIFTVVFIGLFLVVQLTFFIGLKFPFITKMENFKNEHRAIAKFIDNIKGAYSIVVKTLIGGIKVDSLSLLPTRIKDLKGQMKTPIIRRYIFNPDMNPIFNNSILFGTNGRANAAFLIEYFVYDLNKFYKNPASIKTTFGRSTLDTWIRKYKQPLFPFLFNLLSSSTTALETEYKDTTDFFQTALIIFVTTSAIVCLLILLYNFFIGKSMATLLEALLYIDEKQIEGLIAKNRSARNFFRLNFLRIQPNDSLIINDKAAISQSNFNQKWRLWTNKGLIFSNSASILLILVFALISAAHISLLFLGLFNNALTDPLFALQKDFFKITDDFNSLVHLVVNAKDFYLHPTYYLNMSDSYKKLIFNGISHQNNGTSSYFSDEQITGAYSKDLCFFMNESERTATLNPCVDIYGGLMKNGVIRIKEILAEKLAFLFTIESSFAYNYSSADMDELDKFIRYFTTGFDGIYAYWVELFAAKRDRTELLLQIVTLIASLVIVGIGGVFYWLNLRRLAIQYTCNRKIFVHFVPTEVLEQQKIVKVKLTNAGIL